MHSCLQFCCREAAGGSKGGIFPTASVTMFFSSDMYWIAGIFPLGTEDKKRFSKKIQQHMKVYFYEIFKSGQVV